MFTKIPNFQRPEFSGFPCVALAFVCISLASCGGGSSGDASAPPPNTVSGQSPGPTGEADGIDVLGVIEDDPVTDSVSVGGDVVPGAAEPGSQEGQVGLIVGSTQRCAVVFESLQVVVTRKLVQGEVADPDIGLPNVSGSVKFGQRFGSSLNLLSRTDEGANFEMRAQDIVGLTASIDNGSVTVFIAGYDREAPPDFIMRKPVPNGCLYAFKSGDYCATGLSKSGPLQFNRNGASMSALGCELDNPDGLPLLEIVP